MAEQTKTKKGTGNRIPEDARQHYRNASQEFRHGFEAMLPPEVREHHRRAGKEMLLAWRSMIDFALEKMEDKKN